MNRKVQAFNDTADRYVLKPVAKGYGAVLPKPVRRGVGNFFSNLLAPITILNQLLQGKGTEGGQDTMRFLVNTTLGVGGIFDVGSKVGLEEHQEDFDQTFARWGVGSGPYLVVPFLGPSTFRGVAGTITSIPFTPIGYLDDASVRNTMAAVYFVDGRAALLDVEELVGGDRYSFLRDAYLQRREFLINDGAVADDPFLDDSDYESDLDGESPDESVDESIE
jgi:phospholipid-binding lipoprotein MlaA